MHSVWSEFSEHIIQEVSHHPGRWKHWIWFVIIGHSRADKVSRTLKDRSSERLDPCDRGWTQNSVEEFSASYGLTCLITDFRHQFSGMQDTVRKIQKPADQERNQANKGSLSTATNTLWNHSIGLRKRFSAAEQQYLTVWFRESPTVFLYKCHNSGHGCVYATSKESNLNTHRQWVTLWILSLQHLRGDQMWILARCGLIKLQDIWRLSTLLGTRTLGSSSNRLWRCWRPCSWTSSDASTFLFQRCKIGSDDCIRSAWDLHSFLKLLWTSLLVQRHEWQSCGSGSG